MPTHARCGTFLCKRTVPRCCGLACCLATEAGVEVCAPVHDAVLICAPVDRLDADVERMQEAMREKTSALEAAHPPTSDLGLRDYRSPLVDSAK